MNKEFKSFYKKVGGNEGDLCNYPVRLDTYGCGCFHDCNYCYAKSLLDFRKLWNAQYPAVADIEKIKRKIKKLNKGDVVRLGGMTDCFQPVEMVYKNTYNTIQALNEQGVHQLIVTKSDIIANDEYMDILDKDLAHIQVSITTTDDSLSLEYETASTPTNRIHAIEKLQNNGFDVSVRLSPLVDEVVDFNKINRINCDKILVEFLRVNHWIKKWFEGYTDMNRYSIKSGGYRHLPLESKIKTLEKIKGFKEVSVCEDVPEHYKYWQENVNYNKKDCCNIGRSV